MLWDSSQGVCINRGCTRLGKALYAPRLGGFMRLLFTLMAVLCSQKLCVISQ